MAWIEWNSINSDAALRFFCCLMPIKAALQLRSAGSDHRKHAVKAQRRNGDQRELTIDYTVRPESPAHTRAWLLVSLAVASTTATLLARRWRSA